MLPDLIRQQLQQAARIEQHIVDSRARARAIDRVYALSRTLYPHLFRDVREWTEPMEQEDQRGGR